MSDNVENNSSSNENTLPVWEQWENITKNFGKNYSSMLPMLGYYMAYINNPFIQNERLKAIPSTPRKFDRAKIEEMLASPQFHENELRAASRYFYNTIAPINKVYNIYADILLYKTYIEMTSKATRSDENKTKREYKRIAKWLEGFDPKRTFKRVTLKSIIEGKAFYVARQDGENLQLQELPAEYCKIVHRWEGGWQFSFNMMYFLRPGVSLEWFPPEFTEYVEEMHGFIDVEKEKIKGDISMLPNDVVLQKNSSKNSWMYWKEIPIGLGWVFGIDDESPSVVPPLMSMFLDASELDQYKALEEALLAIPLKQLLTAEIPFQGDGKSGTYSNNTSITPDIVAYFEDAIRRALPSSVGFAAAPFEEFKVHNFDSVASRNNIVGNSIQNFYSQMGISGLLSTDSKPNLSQVKSAQITEVAYVDKVYHQYEYFLNYFVRNMGLSNSWKVFIHGDRFSEEKEKNALKEGLTLGMKNLMPKFLSFYDTYLSSAESTSYLVDCFELYENFQPLVSTFQSKGGSDNKNGGRPRANESSIESDNTAKSIEAGSNVSDGRNVETFSLDRLEEMSELLTDMGVL